ncbi:TPA: hypothetical protein ACGO3H_000492 [Streptococcus suis]
MKTKKRVKAQSRKLVDRIVRKEVVLSLFLFSVVELIDNLINSQLETDYVACLSIAVSCYIIFVLSMYGKRVSVEVKNLIRRSLWHRLGLLLVMATILLLLIFVSLFDTIKLLNISWLYPAIINFSIYMLGSLFVFELLVLLTFVTPIYKKVVD